jgi:hypothetical protein
MKAKKGKASGRSKKLKSAKGLKGVKPLGLLNPQPLPPRVHPIV